LILSSTTWGLRVQGFEDLSLSLSRSLSLALTRSLSLALALSLSLSHSLAAPPAAELDVLLHHLFQEVCVCERERVCVFVCERERDRETDREMFSSTTSFRVDGLGRVGARLGVEHLTGYEGTPDSEPLTGYEGRGTRLVGLGLDPERVEQARALLIFLITPRRLLFLVFVLFYLERISSFFQPMP